MSIVFLRQLGSSRPTSYWSWFSSFFRFIFLVQSSMAQARCFEVLRGPCTSSVRFPRYVANSHVKQSICDVFYNSVHSLFLLSSKLCSVGQCSLDFLSGVAWVLRLFMVEGLNSLNLLWLHHCSCPLPRPWRISCRTVIKMTVRKCPSGVLWHLESTQTFSFRSSACSSWI